MRRQDLARRFATYYERLDTPGITPAHIRLPNVCNTCDKMIYPGDKIVSKSGRRHVNIWHQKCAKRIGLI